MVWEHLFFTLYINLFINILHIAIYLNICNIKKCSIYVKIPNRLLILENISQEKLATEGNQPYEFNFVLQTQ